MAPQKKGASAADAAVEPTAVEAEGDFLKKPKTAYFTWLTANRAALEKQCGAKRASEVSKFAGAKWKELPEAEKEPYVAAAAKEKKEYDEKIAAGAQKKPVKRKAKDDGNDGKAKKPRKARAPTAYWLWLADNRERITKEIGSSKPPLVAKEAGKQWKETVSESVKAKYQAKADEAKAALKAKGEDAEEDAEEDGEEEEEDAAEDQ